MSLVTSPGLLLRAHDYSESSKILRFLTPRMGIVAVIAKGVRRRSARGREPIRTFGEGTLTFSRRPDRDLHTLRDFVPLDATPPIRGFRQLTAASLLAELVLVHSLEEGNPELYQWIRESLAGFAEPDDTDLTGKLLAGAWRTLCLLGFPPELTACVRCGSELDEDEGDGLCRLDIPAGGLICPSCAVGSALPRVGPTARRTLMDLVGGSVPDELRGVGSHLSILESFALHHLAPPRRFRTFNAIRAALGDEEQAEEVVQ